MQQAAASTRTQSELAGQADRQASGQFGQKIDPKTGKVKFDEKRALQDLLQKANNFTGELMEERDEWKRRATFQHHHFIQCPAESIADYDNGWEEFCGHFPEAETWFEEE